MIVGIFSQQEIKTRVGSLASEIADDYVERPGKGRSSRPGSRDPVIFLIVLKGAAMFGADLARALFNQRMPLQVEYCRASSYGDARESSGSVNIKLPDIDFGGRRVLIVEDIIDTGRTMTKLVDSLSQGAASVKTVALLDKHGSRQIPFNADYTGIKIGNTFVVGYGMDDKGLYRELPFVGRIEANVPTGTNDYYPKEARSRFLEDPVPCNELKSSSRGA